MQHSFPMLGNLDRRGLRGMFIGEEHTDARHMQRMLMCWSILATQIDALFLEVLAHDMTLPMTLHGIQRAVEQSTNNEPYIWRIGRRWAPPSRYYDTRNQYYGLAERLLMLSRRATATGTPVFGIDINQALPGDRYTAWLRSAPPPSEAGEVFREEHLLHDAWDQVVEDKMARLGKTRFAVYGGVVHGPPLRRLIPQLACYTIDWETGNYREYKEFDARNQVVWR